MKINTYLALTLYLTSIFAFAWPQGVLFLTAEAQKPPTQQPDQFASGSILDIIAQNPDTQIFVQAIEAGDLTKTLQGPGPFTVFVPTDEAFKKMGKEQLDALFKPENKARLRTILFYHIAPGNLFSSELESTTIPTANGNDVHVQVSQTGIKINNSQVVQADIEGSNGVAHIIDEILVP